MMIISSVVHNLNQYQSTTPTPRLSSDVSVFFPVRALLPANVLWGLEPSSQTSILGSIRFSSEKSSISPGVCFLGIPLMINWWFRVGGLEIPENERDWDSNPKPPGPKPPIYHWLRYSTESLKKDMDIFSWNSNNDEILKTGFEKCGKSQLHWTYPSTTSLIMDWKVTCRKYPVENNCFQIPPYFFVYTMPFVHFSPLSSFSYILTHVWGSSSPSTPPSPPEVVEGVMGR